MNVWIVSSVTIGETDTEESVTLRLEDKWTRSCTIYAPVGTHHTGQRVVLQVYPLEGDD